MPIETLRPNAAGDAAAHTVTGTSNWAAVGDVDDTTYLRNNTGTTLEDDLGLNDPATVTASDSVDSIDIRFRARSETTAVAVAQVGLRLGGVNSLATSQTAIPTAATDYSRTAITRPGGGSWTYADLAALQVAIQTNDGAAAAIRFFEVYVDVNYTVGGAITTDTTRFMPFFGIG